MTSQPPLGIIGPNQAANGDGKQQLGAGVTDMDTERQVLIKCTTSLEREYARQGIHVIRVTAGEHALTIGARNWWTYQATCKSRKYISSSMTSGTLNSRRVERYPDQ